MPLGRHSGPYAIRHAARSPRPGICNPYRIEFCPGTVTRGSHVRWQPRARICKSFRLVSALDVFRWVGPNFGSILGSTTDSRTRLHDPTLLKRQSTSQFVFFWMWWSARESTPTVRKISKLRRLQFASRLSRFRRCLQRRLPSANGSPGTHSPRIGRQNRRFCFSTESGSGKASLNC